MNFNRSILDWYSENKRNLPWRETADPYKIWVSEIILQQTRVNQGMTYYDRFINIYPNITSLASAKEEAVLKVWQGLGYYSRARNMHATAKVICSKHNAVFPKTYQDILKLKGIGEYTAAAICSFAFNQKYAVLDGNVFRVLSRFFGVRTPIDTTLGKKEFQKLANKNLSQKNPGTYNQAIMDFGAIQCTPTNPNCGICPINYLCSAYENDYVKELPIKQKKQTKRTRTFNYLVFLQNENTYIEKRKGNDIWKNLFEFPLIEGTQILSKKSLITLLSKNFNLKEIADYKIVSCVKLAHHLTHQKIVSTFWKIVVCNTKVNLNKNQIIQIKSQDINKYPLHRLTEKYLESKCVWNDFSTL